MDKKRIVTKLAKVIEDTDCAIELNLPANAVAEYLYRHLEALELLNNLTNRPKVVETTLPLVESSVSEATKASDVEINDFVDRMYALYPTKCPKRNASLGKSRTDKLKIRKLLKTYTMEEIEQVIRAEVDGSYGVHYMKNFSTFLNNFPEPIREIEAPVKGSVSTGKVIINGIEYR